MYSTLFSQIAALVTIDVDSMDPEDATQHTNSLFKFCDMTSNQAIVQGQVARVDRADILEGALKSVKSKAGDLISKEDIVEDVLDLLTVLFAKAVYPNLKGRVHAQASPSNAYDTEKTVAHAKKLISIFEANGIPKERVCIKIPATAQSIIACQYLEKIGIRTLATCLFSVEQAVAASQAGCLYVAPYFNELRVHFDPTLWKEYKDTAREHPMALVIQDILGVFEASGSKTLVMPASIVTAAEVIGLTSLRPDHLTIAGGVLSKLAALPSIPEGDLTKRTPQAVASIEVTKTDFLINNAEALEKALRADPEATRKLADALKIFGEMEQKTRDIIVDKIGSD